MSAALKLSLGEPGHRLVAGDYWLENGREDIYRLLLDKLPREMNGDKSRGKKRIDELTKAQEASMPEWRDRWIGIGLKTEPADRPLFEAAVTACYRYAGIEAPRVIWCPSPIVAALAGPIAAHLLRRAKRGDAVEGAVGDAVGDAVGGAVGDAVGDAVGGAVGDAVGGAVRDAVGGAVRDADPAVLTAAGNEWWRIFGGQFWVGGWWWGSPSFVSFFMDACNLRLERDIELRARAYAATCMSACWWWPARGHVLVSERPSELRIESGKLKLVKWDGWEVRR